jgi:hypothetical protein
VGPKTKVSIIEIGAGTAVATVRREGESFLEDSLYETTLIRINPISEGCCMFMGPVDFVTVSEDKDLAILKGGESVLVELLMGGKEAVQSIHTVIKQLIEK